MEYHMTSMSDTQIRLTFRHRIQLIDTQNPSKQNKQVRLYATPLKCQPPV